MLTSENGNTDNYAADTDYQQDHAHGMHIEATGGSSNSKFEDGTDND